MKIIEELNILKYFKIFLNNIRLILITCSIGIAFGIFHSLSIKNQYKSQTIILPQLSSSQSSTSLNSFAKAAGFNFQSSNYKNNEIPPNLYPLLLESYEVKNEILNIKINDISFKTLIKEYYNSKSSIGVIHKIISFFKNIIVLNDNNSINNKFDSNNLIYISKEDQFYFDILNDIVFINLNENEGFIEISTLFPNPNISALITESTKDILQNKIINFRIQAASETVKYLKKNYSLKKNELEFVEKKLANFKDKNQTISSSTYNIELVSLESEYNFTKSVYSQIASQLEDAKLELNKNTPTFTVIDPVRIPNSKSYPNRTQIVLIYFFSFFILISSYLFFKEDIILVIKKVKYSKK